MFKKDDAIVSENVIDVLVKLAELREEQTKNIKAKKEYDNFFQNAINKFSYIVQIHSRKYKKFPNYMDLVQEGYVGLILAFNNFDVERSKNFYKIANWYVKTRIKRAANKHEVFHVPMGIAKDMPPNRLSELPIIVEASPNACETIENEEAALKIKEIIMEMSPTWRKVICKFYGISIDKKGIRINTDSKRSIADISQEMSISRVQVQRIISKLSKRFSAACD